MKDSSTIAAFVGDWRAMAPMLMVAYLQLDARAQGYMQKVLAPATKQVMKHERSLWLTFGSKEEKQANLKRLFQLSTVLVFAVRPEWPSRARVCALTLSSPATHRCPSQRARRPCRCSSSSRW